VDLHQIWHSRRARRRNHLYQIFRWLVKGCGFCGGSKIAISDWQGQSPLTQGWHYHAARDVLSYPVNVNSNTLWQNRPKYATPFLGIYNLKFGIFHACTKPMAKLIHTKCFTCTSLGNIVIYLQLHTNWFRDFRVHLGVQNLASTYYFQYWLITLCTHWFLICVICAHQNSCGLMPIRWLNSIRPRDFSAILGHNKLLALHI